MCRKFTEDNKASPKSQLWKDKGGPGNRDRGTSGGRTQMNFLNFSVNLSHSSRQTEPELGLETLSLHLGVTTL